MFADLDRNRRSTDFQIVPGSVDRQYRSVDYAASTPLALHRGARDDADRRTDGRADGGGDGDDGGLDCTDGFEPRVAAAASVHHSQSEPNFQRVRTCET